jgi:hypothetical protein
VVLLAAPEDFPAALGELPAGTSVSGELPAGRPADVIVYFVTWRHELAARLAELRAGLATAGGLWVAWPKKAARVHTDMTEQVVRELALPTGLVDNKVCAIDETWSGLRLVIRLVDRP